jgi:chemotaxis protein histidine kinase CheA
MTNDECRRETWRQSSRRKRQCSSEDEQQQQRQQHAEQVRRKRKCSSEDEQQQQRQQHAEQVRRKRKCLSEDEQQQQRQQHAEQVRRKRKCSSEDEQQQQRQQHAHAEQVRRKRKCSSEDQQQQQRQQHAEQVRRKRKCSSEDQQQQQRQQHAEQVRRNRHSLSEDQQQQQRQQNAEQVRNNRHALSEDQQQQQRQQHTQQVRRNRQLTTEISLSAVNNTTAIISGQTIVIPFSIGDRTQCMYCSAKLWNHETNWTSICCSKRNVVLDKWKIRDMASSNQEEQSAGLIHNLWMQDNREGRLLRDFARPLNNALALASQVVEEGYRPLGQRAFRPNLVIRGQLFHKIAVSLLPQDGAIPKFAQIYVYDPEQDQGAEANVRLGHMRLRSGVTERTRQQLLQLLTKLQGWLRKCNPYVRDFVQVCEIPSNLIENMNLVISPTIIKPKNH